MSKLLSTIWDRSEPIFQDGSGGDDDHDDANSTDPIRYLTHVGERLDDPTSIYHRVGKHGWESFAKDIVQVYHRHVVVAANRSRSSTTTAATATGSLAQQQILHIQTLFREIHPDLEKTITDVCSGSTHHSSNSRSSSGHHHTTIATPNAKDPGANGSGDLGEMERKYFEALQTYIQELLSSASVGNSNNSSSSQQHNNHMKKAKQLLQGFRCQVTNTNRTSRKYEVQYFNSTNRRFRSRVEVGRFLQLISENDHDPSDYDSGKKRATTTTTNHHHHSTPSSSSSLKRRRTTTANVPRDAEKKRIRNDIERLRKAHHRATKALDDYMTTTTTTTATTVPDTTTSDIDHHHPPQNGLDDGHHHHMKDSIIRSRRPDRIQFPNVPIHCTPEVLMTWDFLCTFHRALSLAPIELDDYVNAITYVPPPGQVGDDVVASPVYVVEAHLALLKLLLQDKSSDDWWWSILETEVLQQQNVEEEGVMNDHDDEGASSANVDSLHRPVVRIDIAATLNEVEDPLITNSWLTTLEKVLNDKDIAVKRKAKVTNAIRTCLKLASNQWIAAYLRKALNVGKVNGSLEMQQAIRWLVYQVRAARPDLRERGVQSNTIRIAREKVIHDVEQQMKSLGVSAPIVTDKDLTESHDYEDESDDESDDEEDDEHHHMDGSRNGYKGDTGNDSELPASVIPPKPLPTLVDLLLPPNKPLHNSELLDAFSWPHIAGATAIRILHRKKRLLNEMDDAVRAASGLPRLTVSERREREQLAASRMLTEVENMTEDSTLEKASLHLSNGGNYLDLSPQERLCILRALMEASYDAVRVYDVVSGNYKQRTGAMKALEVEQRRAKREAKEKVASDEATARERLSANIRERFLHEQREEIRKLNDKSKEFSDDVIESLTDEDIIDFDDDIKADYEALPGPESFTKVEVSHMITKLLEESAFETHDLQVLTMSEITEKEKREFEELEGRYIGYGGESALEDDSLDRETVRTLQGLRREVERARTLAETLPDLRSNAIAQLKEALDDGRIKVLRTAYTVAKKSKLVGSNDDTGGVWALDLMRDAALELEKAKQNKRVLDAQKDLVAKRNKCFIRTEPMGRDRYGSRFWSFTKKSDDGDADDGTVWVETEFDVRNKSTMETDANSDHLSRHSESIFFGAHDMEDDFAPKDHKDKFLQFSRCEYHTTGFSSNLALQHWGCHSTEESLRSLIKSLDSRGPRETDLKSKLKEILEETLGSGESEKVDSLVPRSTDDIDTDDTDIERLRYDGDEAVFIEAKDAANGIDNMDTEAFDDLYSGIGANVRIRQVLDPSKDPQVARYENGTIDAWKLCVKKADIMEESENDQPDVVEFPSWRAVSERGRILWLTGEELMESLSRFAKWKQGQGYFENDAAFFLYRNGLGKFSGKNSEAAYAASPYYFAKMMIKKESELYPKLKTRNMENSWSGQNGARALWTNSMKDYAYDFQTVKQGLLTLENALFELTGGFASYDFMDIDDRPLDVAAMLKDSSTAFDIELESIEKNLPGLWNSPKVRTVFLFIVEQSTTTGFLALALDLLCRNTMKYLQTHNLLNVRGNNDHHFQTSSSFEVPSGRTTRRMNAWQQQQQQGSYY